MPTFETIKDIENQILTQKDNIQDNYPILSMFMKYNNEENKKKSFYHK